MAPTVVSSQPSTAGPTVATSVTFAVVLGETVYNVDATDFQLTTTGTAVGRLGSVAPGNGTSFTVTVDTLTGEGTLRLDLKSGTDVQDAAGNVVPGYAAGGTVTLGLSWPVTDSVPSLAGGTIPAGTASLQVSFSEPLVGGGTAGDYQLQGVGPDGLLGTADDTIIPLTLAYAADTATLNFTPLAESVYRLTVRDEITDGNGNALDGDGNGTAGGDSEQDFAVVPGTAGMFVSASAYPTGIHSDPESIVAADFNNDGFLDLVTANSGSDNCTLSLGNGSGGFVAVGTFDSGGSYPSSVTVGDFNADGKNDLAVANWESHNVGVLLGNRAGGFAAATTYASGGSSPSSVTVGDFNADGKNDLAVANYDHNVGVLYRNVGVLLNAGEYKGGVRELNTPHAVRFHVQTRGFGAGQLVEATGNAFDGASRLDVFGQTHAPTLPDDYLTDGQRTLVTPTAVIAGLYVSRDVTVPAIGSEDFARTVDVFRNPTDSPIATTVRIVGNLGSDAATTICSETRSRSRRDRATWRRWTSSRWIRAPAATPGPRWMAASSATIPRRTMFEIWTVSGAPRSPAAGLGRPAAWVAQTGQSAAPQSRPLGP